MKEKIHNSVVVRFIEHRAGVMNQAPTKQARSCSIYRAITNQRGATLIMVTIAMVVIFGFAVLAIDVSMMLLARTQLKNAADAAVLAGASVLALDSTDTEGATAKAIEFAGLNVAVQEGLSPVAIVDTDVVISPDGHLITVHTHRTMKTNDPVSLFFLSVIDTASGNKGNVEARSSAKVRAVCATDCLKPWAVPDKWHDADSNGAFDPGIDFYAPGSEPGGTGYRAPDDVGQLDTITLGNPQAQPKWPASGIFFPINFTPVSGGVIVRGAEWYETWIQKCEPYIVGIGDELEWEPGVMPQKTEKGVQQLIDQDPDAYWDGKTVVSAYAVSPRIIKLAFFDPRIPFDPGRGTVVVAQIGALFLEDRFGHGSNQNIVVRFIKWSTHGEGCDDPGSFMYTVALVPGPEED